MDLIELIKSGNSEKAANIIQKIDDISMLKDEEFNANILHWSSFENHLDLTKMILARKDGAKLINEITKYNDTPLHLACFEGHVDIVHQLLLFNAREDIIGEENLLACDLKESSNKALSKQDYQQIKFHATIEIMIYLFLCFINEENPLNSKRKKRKTEEKDKVINDEIYFFKDFKNEVVFYDVFVDQYVMKFLF